MDRRGRAPGPRRAGRADDGRAVRGARRGDRQIAPAWRLIDSGAGPGAWNLALDDAIFGAVSRRHSPPTLRFYRWSEPTLSIGYSQRLERDVDVAACAARGIRVVRRISGGRAVLHDAELTYSVSAPAGLPGFGDGLEAAFRHIAAGLIAGLRLLGVGGAVAAQGRRAPSGSPRDPRCFAAAARHEIQVGGRKLVGSAQRRADGGFLQHGSVLVRSHGEELGAILRGGARGAGPSMVGLADLLEPCPPPQALAAALAAGCATAWGCRMEPGGPASGELDQAAALEAGRYRSADWTAGRRPGGPGPR